MGRSFDFNYDGRVLTVRPICVDEGWELWIMDGEKRLACGGRISIDEAVAAGRAGQDKVRRAAEEIGQRIVENGLAAAGNLPAG
jgi:hypothetical protein